MLRFDEFKQLLAKPGTTLEDVKRVAGAGIAIGASTVGGVGATVRMDKDTSDDAP